MLWKLRQTSTWKNVRSATKLLALRALRGLGVAKAMSLVSSPRKRLFFYLGSF